jgi:glutamate dehydrogenase (NAD(P)+)
MARDPFAFADELGPARVVHLAGPLHGLRAIVVVDNTARGPAIGGTRMAADATLEECARLARAMSLKNAAAGLPHGGAKSVILADPRMAPEDKENIVRAFAGAIADIRDYIPGPDMGTDERAMAWVHDEIGRAVGLPAEIGGIPLDEIGATGFGVAVAAEVAQDFCDVTLAGARVAIQGFGAVGRHAARFLGEKGAIVVAASDSRGTVHDPGGLDVEALIAAKAEGRAVGEAGTGDMLGRDEIIGVDCDIWIPAARPDVLTAETVDRLKAKLVVQGANIPVSKDAERTLYARGVLSITDFIANAGGVICAAVEYRGGARADAFAAIDEKIRENTRLVLENSKAQKVPPYKAAGNLAKERLRDAIALRRWAPA